MLKAKDVLDMVAQLMEFGILDADQEIKALQSAERKTT